MCFPNRLDDLSAVAIHAIAVGQIMKLFCKLCMLYSQLASVHYIKINAFKHDIAMCMTLWVHDTCARYGMEGELWFIGNLYCDISNRYSQKVHQYSWTGSHCDACSNLLCLPYYNCLSVRKTMCCTYCVRERARTWFVCLIKFPSKVYCLFNVQLSFVSKYVFVCVLTLNGWL
jgi:hypothetical protein